jgi:hypothetical protein
MGSSERTLDDVELHHIVLLREDDENFVIAGPNQIVAHFVMIELSTYVDASFV